MKNIKLKLLTGFSTFALLANSFPMFAIPSFAAGKAHVRIVGSSKTIFFGDVDLSGCTVKDESNVSHTYTDSFAVCELDAASKAGNFTYGLKDFGGQLGLFIDQIDTDKGASDFSTYWGYDLNGQAAQQGISNQTVKDGDKLFFHFTDLNADSNKRAINDGVTYLKSQQNPDGSIAGFAGVNAWASMAFSAAGSTNDPLINYLSTHTPASDAAATEWEKAILAITAAGKNPFDFGGTNYEAKLESLHTNGQLGSTTQVNDDIFGLLALIASGPNVSSSIKQDSLNFIIAHQLSDGGFSWSTTGTSDADDTAAALQALVAAQNKGMDATGLADAITKAKTFLLSEQKSDGGFVSSSSDTAGNTATTSWAIMAMNALGMGSDDKTKNALTFIRNNQQENGSFAWQSSSTGETFTSSYAIPALTGKSWPIGIFSDTASVTPTETVTPTNTPSPTLGITETPSPTQAVSVTPSLTPTEAVSITPTISLTATPTPTATVTPSPTPTTAIPSVSPASNATDAISNEIETTATPTPTGISGDVLGLNNEKETHKNKEKEIKKKVQKDLRDLKKHNRTIYNQIQELLEQLNQKIRFLFHKK